MPGFALKFKRPVVKGKERSLKSHLGVKPWAIKIEKRGDAAKAQDCLDFSHKKVTIIGEKENGPLPINDTVAKRNNSGSTVSDGSGAVQEQRIKLETFHDVAGKEKFISQTQGDKWSDQRARHWGSRGEQKDKRKKCAYDYRLNPKTRVRHCNPFLI